MTPVQEAALAHTFRNRRRNVWPQKRDGSLTRAGDSLALDFLCGVAMGMAMAGVPDKDVPTNLAFIASIRGADEAMEKLLERVDERAKAQGEAA